MNKKVRKSGRSKRTARFRNLSVLLAVLLVVTLVIGAGAAEGTVNRIGGDDRYQTSVLLAEEAFSDGAATVIIARGDQAGNFADGLASSVLSGALDAPVLLTKPNALPADIKTAIRSLGATRAIVLGGTEAISSSVVAGLRDLNLTVSRIEGKDRYETAAKVAREADKKGYIRSYAFIVNGFATADSLVAAPAAFRDNAVILQVAKNSIPKATKEALKDLNINKIYIIGGTAVVSQTVERELEKSYIVKRYGGADRYETSVLVAEGLFPGVDQMVLAGGPDAHLVDSIGACMFGKPILYVKKNEIPRVVEYYLEDTITAYSDPLIIGGTAAISKLVEGAVDKILEKAEDGGSDPGATPVYSTTVKTVAAFRKAIENNNIRTITLGENIIGNVTATRSGITNLTINFGHHRLTGSLAITANSIKTLNLNGWLKNAITGDLTVEANKATVTNSLSVGGTVYIQDVSSASWIERVNGNTIILTDDNGATIIIEGQPGSVTVEAGAGENGDINIIVHRPVTITVENGAEVANITVEEEADGTSIINDGTIETVTADGNVEIENNSDSPIEVSGDGTATVSGEGADQVTGVVSAITMTTDVVLDGETIEYYDLSALPYGAEVTVTLGTKDSEEDVTFYYTTDGEDPNVENDVYGEAFTVEVDDGIKDAVEKTIKVIARKDGHTDRTGEFTIKFKPKYFTLIFDITVVKDGEELVSAQDESVVPMINVFGYLGPEESGDIVPMGDGTYKLETDKWYNYTIKTTGDEYFDVLGQVTDPEDIGDEKTLAITLVKVDPPTKSYYSAGDDLAFAISKLIYNQEGLEVGMPIYTGGGWPWACNELVLAGSDEFTLVTDERNGETIRFWVGTTSADGKLAVGGIVREDLPYGALSITLPYYGYTIDNAFILPSYLGGAVSIEEKNDVPYNPYDPDETVVVGDKLTAKVQPIGATVAYEWQRAETEDGNYEVIGEATGTTSGSIEYELTGDDLDSWIRVKVTSTSESQFRWGTSYSDPVGL